MTPSSEPLLTVIVPAYQCAPMLRRCLEALQASDCDRASWELIVADDGSTDDTSRVARAVADLVVSTPDGPRGPGFARNLAAQSARGALLMFVDADVLVAPTTVRGMLRAFAAHPDAVAISGSYDANPVAPGLVSQYRNLLHHYVHHQGAGVVQTFWAGCGAVRRDAFLAAGGFDTHRYQRPAIEDIELGYRLGARGGVLYIDPTLQGAHLKQWTLWGMIRTDFRDRAVPWMRLLLQRGEAMAHGSLNVQQSERLLTVFAGGAVITPVLALVQRDPRWLIIGLQAIVIIILANVPLLRWFAKQRGTGFALRATPLRVVFYVVSACGAAWAILTRPWQQTFSPLAPLASNSGSRAEANA